MYEQFFGLSEKPFALTPNPHFVFYSRRYREAEDQLLYAIEHKEGFMLVTGQPGTGKTTLCRDLLNKLDPDRVRSALMFNPFLTGVEMLATLLTEFGVEYPPTDSRKQLLDRRNQYLLLQLVSGFRCVAIFDEAQHLSTELLEQIRVLSNLETDYEKLIQIILVGQPELLERIRTPGMAQLDQRVSVRCALSHLDDHETDRYIHHRLNVAGARGQLRIDDRAVRAIHQASKGVPRVINLVADRALLAAYVAQTRDVAEEHVTIALAALSGEDTKFDTIERIAASRARLRTPRAKRIVAWATAAVVVLVALAIGGRRLSSVATPEVLYRRATAAAPQQSDQLYTRIVREYPGSARAEVSTMRLAELAIARGDGAAALRQMDELRARTPPTRYTSRLVLMTAQLHLASGDSAAACRVPTVASLTENEPDIVRQRAALTAICSARETLRLALVRQDSIARADSLTRTAQSDSALSAASVAQASVTTAPLPSAPPPSTRTANSGSNATPATAQRTGYTVQIAAYENSAEANASATALAKRGMSARVVPDGRLFLLHVGQFETREAARAGELRLRARALPGFVVAWRAP